MADTFQQQLVFRVSQQEAFTAEQPHDTTPVSIPFNTAAAHPTPGVTSIAPNAQLRAQAPHSMHLSRSIICAFPF